MSASVSSPWLVLTRPLPQVNSTITSESGGTCVCPRTEADFACDLDQEYLMCLGVVKRDIVTATAAIAALTSVRRARSPCPYISFMWRLTVRVSVRA